MAWSDFTTATITPLAGDNTATASPTGDATADLVSAATNTGGIIVTAVSLSLSIFGTSDMIAPYLRLLAGGVIQLENRQRRRNSDPIHTSMGGFCSIQVAAGEAVSYNSAMDGTTGSYAGYVRIAWRHKV